MIEGLCYYLTRLTSKSQVLWAVARFVFKDKFISLREMDLSEIHLIEREKEEEEEEHRRPGISSGKKLSWWRKWLV